MSSSPAISVLAAVHPAADDDLQDPDAQHPDALLTAVLNAVHAAIYGYGLLGARLPTEQQRLAREAGDVLRADRDVLAGLLRQAGQPVPGPLPAYDLTLTDELAAQRLATGLEEGLALRWVDLVAGTDDPDLRTTATQAVGRSAVRAARWRAIRGLTPSVRFPGSG